jgi:response regulator RpfG family c-di-GMP phosphodiesterase
VATLSKNCISEKSTLDALKKPSVLLIDDSFDTLDIHRMMLEMDGFEVFTAQSGAEAFSVLSAVTPDLILLDYFLGDMNGVGFLDQLEKINPFASEHIPVVFLSGLEEVPKSRAIGLIHKPADMNYFLEAVHTYIEANARAH